MRVLVVEDEQLLADAIAEGLRQQAIAADVAYDGDDGMDRLAVNEYDVVVLDRDLPTLSGDEVCRRIVLSGGHSRVLMLTASTTVDDRVGGLSLGADDYLGKPFAFVELVARIRALARRSRPLAPPVLEKAGLWLDPNRREVLRNNRPIYLSLKEFAVLEELMRADGAVVSAECLLERVWDENIDPFTNVVRVTVMTLRRKLGQPPLITTVRGAGYELS
ncbi:response regulator transcription factor [Fodinicola feengrottensis]|uniref:Response regulator transcription factor n=1 Tax=Fodinicola feengrottensis TaxID=435914 RepID=A0ABN2FRJ9_9ACTN